MSKVYIQLIKIIFPCLYEALYASEVHSPGLVSCKECSKSYCLLFSWKFFCFATSSTCYIRDRNVICQLVS